MKLKITKSDKIVFVIVLILNIPNFYYNVLSVLDTELGFAIGSMIGILLISLFFTLIIKLIVLGLKKVIGLFKNTKVVEQNS